MAGHGVKPPPLNLSDVRSFDKSALRKTETTVTNADGSRIIEGRDADGNLYRRPSESSCHGFVIDLAEDLQVAEVRPGIIMGMFYKVTSFFPLSVRRNILVPNIFNFWCSLSS